MRSNRHESGSDAPVRFYRQFRAYQPIGLPVRTLRANGYSVTKQIIAGGIMNRVAASKAGAPTPRWAGWLPHICRHRLPNIGGDSF